MSITISVPEIDRTYSLKTMTMTMTMTNVLLNINAYSDSVKYSL